VHLHLQACISQKQEKKEEKKEKGEEVAVIVPSKNESIIYNYHIDEYLYLKVRKTPVSNPSTTHSQNSRGRRRRSK
jgi:hypothetical protein